MEGKIAVRDVALVVLILLGVALVCTYLYGCNKDTPVALAEDGVAELDMAMLRNSPLLLVGQWKKYDGLYDFDQAQSAGYSIISDVRRDRLNGNLSYGLTVLVDNAHDICLNFGNYYSRVWINGWEIVPVESERYVLEHYSDGTGVYEIVVQFNIHAIKLGCHGIVVGTDQQIINIRNTIGMVDGIFIGVSAMLFALCIALYAKRKSERYLLLLALRVMIEVLHIFRSRLPYFDFQVPLVAGFAATVLFMVSKPLSYVIARDLLNRPVNKWLNRAVLGYTAFAVAVFLGVYFTQSKVLDVTPVVYLFFVGYMVFLCMRNACPGCIAMFVGFCIKAGFEIHFNLINRLVMSYDLYNVSNNIMRFGEIVLMTGFAMAACTRFAQKFNRADELAAQLDREVQLQTRELKESYDRIKTMQEDQVQFMTNMVHNIKSPLFALGGYMDLLEDELTQPTESQKHYMDLINKKLEYVNHMAEDMFLIGKLQEGKIRYEKHVFDLCEFIQLVVDGQRPKALEQDVSLVVKCPQVTMICADRYMLQQALDNLMDNAIRHSPKGGKVFLTAGVLGGIVRISVADEGPGVPKEQQPRLFQRYYSKGSGGSTGLGLSISKAIITQQGGTLRYEDREQGGARFVICLPDEREERNV